MTNRYIQIYSKSANYSSQRLLIESCGSDSVIPLDGRWSLGHCIDHAIDHCRKNKHVAFRIMKKKGDNWGHMLTDVYRVSPNSVEC